MTHERTVPIDDTEQALRAWDWKAELDRQDRTVIWLARQTGRNYQQVYRFAKGDQVPDLAWLKDAALILGTIVPPEIEVAS